MELFVFVPLLVFASSQKICLFHLRDIATPASILATVGIVISMLVFALVFRLGLGFGWLESLLFGTIVSATDPLAVGALIQGNDGDAWRPCQIFPGKAVAAAGWCSVWAPKT